MAEPINAGMGPEKPKGQIRGIWAITIIIVIAMLVGGGIWYWYYRGIQNQDLGNVSFVKTPSVIPSTSASASPSTSGADETADWKTYTNSTYSFSVKYPSNWQYSTSKPSNGSADYRVDFVLIGTKDDINDTISLSIDGNSTLEEWTDAFSFCDISDKTIAGLQGKLIICASTASSKRPYMYYVEKNNTTYGFRIESKNNQDILDKMIDTFKFL